LNCKLFVFRHSETLDNSRGIFSGWRDSDLSPRGRAQAEVIAEQLKHFRIDYAFSSHLKRARETLRIVLDDHKPIPTFIDDRLIERCYGLWQGREKRQIQEEDSNTYEQCHRGYNFTPPEGESLEMVEKRVLSFLAQLMNWLKQNPGNVAISCHNNSIRPLRKKFENLSLTQMCKLESPQDKALIYNLEITGGADMSLQNHRNTKAKWSSLRVPKSVRLASDHNNSLKIFYSQTI
jgi:2,3-bisphosphoglycerate-dependent phosphoglycerate mutase